MTSQSTTEYQPTTVSPPGETLAEVLLERGMTQADLAARMGRPPKLVNEIIKGKARITEETAIELERTLGASAAFWLARQAKYREWLQRCRSVETLSKDADWLKEIPVRELENRGRIEPAKDATTRVERCLHFFGVASVGAWRTRYAKQAANFRASPKVRAAQGAVAAWLRIGELEGSALECAEFNTTVFKSVVSDARSLTTNRDPSNFLPLLGDRCRGAGVALVLVRAFPGCPMSGATLWLTPAKALLMLSARHLSDDHLWFSFFHEAGHILLHSKKACFVDLGKRARLTDEERQANTFAREHLIPRQYDAELTGLNSHGAIMEFAQRIGISAGIVVGRLQHDRKRYNLFNSLKVSYRWTDE